MFTGSGEPCPKAFAGSDGRRSLAVSFIYESSITDFLPSHHFQGRLHVMRGRWRLTEEEEHGKNEEECEATTLRKYAGPRIWSKRPASPNSNFAQQLSSHQHQHQHQHPRHQYRQQRKSPSDVASLRTSRSSLARLLPRSCFAVTVWTAMPIGKKRSFCGTKILYWQGHRLVRPIRHLNLKGMSALLPTRPCQSSHDVQFF